MRALLTRSIICLIGFMILPEIATAVLKAG